MHKDHTQKKNHEQEIIYQFIIKQNKAHLDYNHSKESLHIKGIKISICLPATNSNNSF